MDDNGTPLDQLEDFILSNAWETLKRQSSPLAQLIQSCIDSGHKPQEITARLDRTGMDHNQLRLCGMVARYLYKQKRQATDGGAAEPRFFVETEDVEGYPI